MSNIVIKVENLSKQYRLGSVGTGSFTHDINRGWHRLRGKENPYSKVGDINDRSIRGLSEYVWALKDINFDVEQGDIIGIIGSNGAGKSTLLKILSKTTTPTTGNIKLKGRVASLLEVGTGFHPELSGRENIFLNGAILGMRRHEIKEKFDEIVDFSGVERYIDTPVKRYSSGMYVRLAFAVAAHLDPEILIVDEVLAVGDAEFQKKALGKMKQVSQGNGRTVLFVSHNMIAIRSLCQQAIHLDKGTVSAVGETNLILDNYLKSDPIRNKLADEDRIEFEEFIYEGARLNLMNPELNNGTRMYLVFHFNFITDRKYSVLFYFYREEELAFCVSDFHAPLFEMTHIAGRKQITLQVPSYLLNPGSYTVHLALGDFDGNSKQYFFKENIFIFEVLDDNFRRGNRYKLGWRGAVSPILQSEMKNR